jgi:hypothetical protein
VANKEQLENIIKEFTEILPQLRVHIDRPSVRGAVEALNTGLLIAILDTLLDIKTILQQGT